MGRIQFGRGSQRYVRAEDVPRFTDFIQQAKEPGGARPWGELKGSCREGEREREVERARKTSCGPIKGLERKEVKPRAA